MADIKFSALPNMSALAGTESMVGLQSGAASLGTPAQINTYVRSTMGTGVSTALSVNVGSAGSVVVNGGALGTPSSGTLTNCTGLPAAGVVGTAAILGANSFTGIQTITPAVNAKGIIGASVTHTADAPFLDIAQTWNNAAVAFTGLKLTVTDTARATTSLVANFSTVNGATYRFSAQYPEILLGTFGAAPNAIGLGAPTIAGDSGSSIHAGCVGGGILYAGNLSRFGASIRLEDAGAKVLNTGGYNFSSDGTSFGAADAGLGRNASGIVEVNNGTAGAFRDLRVRSPIMTGSAASTAAAGEIALSGGTQSTVGAAGGASALPATPTGYIKINVAGTAMVVPYYAAA